MSDTVGIDFGTTTTVVAFHNGGKTEIFKDPAASVVRDPPDEEIIPTFVSFHPRGQIPAGRVAKARRRLDPVNTIHSFKRIIGLKSFHEDVKLFRKWYPVELHEGGDEIPRFKTRAGEFTAGEISTYLFKYLREHDTISAAKEVVVTVPPTFTPEQGEAIREAAKAAEFSNVHLFSEAYAAALPFLEGEEAQEKRVVVYDLGGGTFDLAVLHCKADGSHQLLGSGGDAYLGGEDIDLRLGDWIVNEVLAKFQWDLRSEDDRFKRTLWAAEQAKVRLSSEDETEVLLTQVDPVLAGKSIIIPRSYLEKHLMTLAQRSFVICDEVLSSAGVAAADVQEVILAGGGSYIPFIQQAVAKYFGVTPRTGLPPDKLVAMGASIAAAKGMAK